MVLKFNLENDQRLQSICGLVEQLWNAFELLGDLAQRPGSSSRAPWSGVEEERDDPGLGVGDVQRELGPNSIEFF